MDRSKADTTSMMFIAGLAVGAGVTALLTPKRGDEVRRSIKQRAEHIRGSIKHGADDVSGTAPDKIDTAKAIVQKATDKLGDLAS